MKAGLALLFIVSMLLPVSRADIWRWTDPETGFTVYGGHPPVGLPAEAVLIREGSKRTSNASSEQSGTAVVRIKARVEALRDQRLERGKRKQEVEEKKVAADQLTQACQAARANLETLEGQGQAAIVEGGESRALSEEERRGYIASTRRFMDEQCSSNRASR